MDPRPAAEFEIAIPGSSDTGVKDCRRSDRVRRRRLLIGLGSSLLIHSTLASPLLTGLPGFPPANSNREDGTSIETRIADSRSDRPTPRLDAPVERSPVEIDPDLGESLPDAMLERLVKQEIERHSEPDNGETAETDLKEMAARLQTISNEKNVGAIAERLGSALGLTPAQAEPPTEPRPTGEFNDAKGMIEDVRVVVDDEGKKTYLALMIDDQGNRLDVPLDEADGAELARLFQLMRDFPLLEKVYKSVVVGLVDRMLQETATPAPSP